MSDGSDKPTAPLEPASGDHASDADKSALSRAEEHILRCLGGALVEQWSSLPTNLQRTLFERAAMLGAPSQLPHLKHQLASFLRARRSDTGTMF